MALKAHDVQFVKNFTQFEKHFTQFEKLFHAIPNIYFMQFQNFISRNSKILFHAIPKFYFTQFQNFISRNSNILFHAMPKTTSRNAKKLFHAIQKTVSRNYKNAIQNNTKNQNVPYMSNWTYAEKVIKLKPSSIKGLKYILKICVPCFHSSRILGIDVGKININAIFIVTCTLIYRM